MTNEITLSAGSPAQWWTARLQSSPAPEIDAGDYGDHPQWQHCERDSEFRRRRPEPVRQRRHVFR
jgi:hypothetical protein